MAFGESNPIFLAGLLLLATAFGALSTLIVLELRTLLRQKARRRRRADTLPGHTEEEMRRRQDLLVQLMELYSGVHSADALSHFLNSELERRHQPWRVRIPLDGPGEIYDAPLE